MGEISTRIMISNACRCIRPHFSWLMIIALVAVVNAQTAGNQAVHAEAKRLQASKGKPSSLSAGTSKLPNGEESGIASAPQARKGSIGPKARIEDDEHMDVVAQQWAAQHPSEAQTGSIAWTVGVGCVLLGTGVMLYSEVCTVLYYREVDDLEASDADGAPASVELRRREYLWGSGWDSRYRPGMTLGGATVVVLSFAAMFYSQCPMIDQIALDYDISATSYQGSCPLLAAKQAVVTGLGLVFFLVGMAWCCTRFVPALLLLLLSIAADIAGSYKGAVPFLLWILGVIGAAAVYSWLKSLDVPASDAAGPAPASARRRKFIPRRQFV